MVSRMREGREDDTLLLLEHPHVFTMGKAAKPEHVLWNEDERRARGVEAIWVDRGGEATYHGPGQLVGYPILDLARLGITIRDYIARLEASLIAYLDQLGIHSVAGAPGLTGVWSEGMKLAAIGIKLNRSVVSHGFALNLTADLDYFEGIVPCGHADLRPTSVEALTGARIDTESAARGYARHFAEVFGVELAWAAPDRLRPVPPPKHEIAEAR
jgi:lipoyl(octanoyl) transferase